jgi:hypothetical protein
MIISALGVPYDVPPAVVRHCLLSNYQMGIQIDRPHVSNC